MISISTAIGLRVLHSSIHYECLECGELVPLGCCTCGPHRRLRPAGLPAELLEALKASDAALRHHPGGDNRSDADIEAAHAAIAKAEGQVE